MCFGVVFLLGEEGCGRVVTLALFSVQPVITHICRNKVGVRRMAGWHLNKRNKAFLVNFQGAAEDGVFSSQDEAGGRFVAFSGEGQSLRKKGRKP